MTWDANADIPVGTPVHPADGRGLGQASEAVPSEMKIVGRYEERVVPHLTLAQMGDQISLARLRDQLQLHLLHIMAPRSVFLALL